ncbi:zinc finger protein-like 1 homolog [Gordionus sp. m RMFG-2023]|uniref:zinc finger protein-like 1 homolog n=1 Tax=Gordionus sp. m RMFG-2023 TaxID=3053472 RepID=UPI0031FD3B1C
MLIDKPTIRFLCLDIFHADCLDQHYSTLPNTTAPNGYTCPTCKECIFFSNNVKSPLAENLRNHFANSFKDTKFPFDLTLISPDFSPKQNDSLPALNHSVNFDKDPRVNPSVYANKNKTSNDSDRLTTPSSMLKSEFVSPGQFNPTVTRQHQNARHTNRDESTFVDNYYHQGNSRMEIKNDKLTEGAVARKLKLFFRKLTFNTGNYPSYRRRLGTSQFMLLILSLVLAFLFFVVFFHRTSRYGPYSSDLVENLEEEQILEYEQEKNDLLHNPMLDPLNNPMIKIRRHR